MSIELRVKEYEDFEKEWNRRHKWTMPKRRRVSSWRLIGGILWWGGIAISAAVVSGAHTIPAALQTIPEVIVSPYREYLSVFIFGIVEMAITAGSVYRRESKIALFIMVIATFAALAGNIGSSITAVNFNQGDVWDMAVGLVFAVLAPAAALGAGELWHGLYRKHQAELEKASVEFEAKIKDREASVNREYSKHVKDTIKAIQEMNSLNSLNEQDQKPVQPVNSANGYSKQMNSRQIIHEFFVQHPEFKNMTLDDLNAAIEAETGVRVGRTSIHNVRKEWDSGNQPLQ